MITTYAANVGANEGTIRNYFAKLIVAYAAYDIMEEQLRNGSLSIIYASDIQHRINALLAAHHDWTHIFTQFGLHAANPYWRSPSAASTW